MSQLPVISLFAGAGGLDLAVHRCAEAPLVQDGADGPLETVVATDWDKAALASFERNFPGVPTLQGDIRQMTSSGIMKAAGLRKGDAFLVVGGPPCTPFSKSGFWLEEKRTSTDPDASLLDEYVRVVRDTQPAGFVLENVQGLTYRTHASQFARLLGQFSELGYNPQWKVLLAADYGVPQLRRRVFVVGRRDGVPFEFPTPTHGGISERHDSSDENLRPYVTARTAFKGLRTKAEPGEIADGAYGELLASVPPGHNYLWHTDRGGGSPVFGWRKRYWTFLLRLEPGRPSTTVQAQPGPWVGPFHWQNVRNGQGELRARRLRVPELLRLMTFPPTFYAGEDRSTVQRQIGNAVPLELGKVVIRSLLEQMGEL
ncbi:MAG: DNA (cytosine-5-)-methyltransferase [Coriobacteriia bacterium]|nr:DNA (cytosine-5-)-methyltransferase [Coriobacteriia bacterium]